MSKFLYSSWTFLLVLTFSSLAFARPEINLKSYTHLGMSTPEADLETVQFLQQSFKRPSNAVDMQHGLVPVYEFKGTDSDKIKSIEKELFQVFFSGPGVIILRNVFDAKLMNTYDYWSLDYLSDPNRKANAFHPKQKDKSVTNGLVELLSDLNPELLLGLIENPVLNGVLDSLIAFSTIGSLTGHLINPNGMAQDKHVDFPTHVGSGIFWEDSPEKLLRMTNQYQLDNILPHTSVQALIAIDPMGPHNGSTSVLPFSHHIQSIDFKIHDRHFEEVMTPHFKQVVLNKGDVIIFNRRLYHAGGHNHSCEKRNALIMQAVPVISGFGQHATDTDFVIKNLRDSGLLEGKTKQEIEDLFLRIKRPYPVDTTKHN